MTRVPRPRTWLRVAGALMLISACTGLATTALHAQEQEVQDLILEVRMGTTIITPAAVVLEKDGRYYLPLIDITENYEFVITDSDVSRGFVQGWYISEENTFSVDREKKEAYHKGERIELTDVDFVDDPYDEKNDIFMQMETFSRIWPEITFTVDLSTLQLLADSTAEFPFMERRERKRRQEFLSARRAGQTGPQQPLPYFRNPYGLINKPTIDLDSSVSWLNNERKLVGQLSANGVQDLAYMTAEYGLTLQREIDGFSRPDALRLTLSRETTPDEPLPLGIERIETGDTRINYREIISNGTGGRGVYVTTNRNDANREFDVITVEGTGPPGWEAELYRNNELIDFGFVDERGEYRFEDVSTQYGNNRIRVVLYGPQGQIREDVKDYNFGSTMLRPGEHNVTAGFVDADRDFIRLSDKDSLTKPEGIARSLAGSYGLTRNVTGFATYNALPTTEGDKTYLTSGVTFAALGGYGQVEAFKELERGQALDMRFLTEILGVRLNMAHTFYDKFESPTAGFGAAAKEQETEITAARTFRLPFGSLGLQLDADRTRRVGGDTEIRFGTRQTLGRGGLQLTNQTNTRLMNGAHENTSGNISANIRMNRWYLRGGLTYSYYPDTRFNSADVDLRYQPGNDFFAGVNFNTDFVSDTVGGGFQVGYDFQKFLGSLDTNWREEEGWEVILRVSTSLGPYGTAGRYNMVSESQRSLAPVRGHAFLDRNLNNQFDEGDEPLPGARLNIDGRASQGKADETGYVISRQGDQPGLANVTIETSSLEDPYYAPGTEGYSVALRKGSMPSMSFPVIETGAIDGTIYGVRDSDPVQGIDIQLVNEKGDIVMATKAAYDGFYTFEFVRPGTYTVRVDPALGINVPPETVTVATDELFASGIDLKLQEQASGADGVFTTARAEAATDQVSFDEEFEKAQEADAADGVVNVEPRSGAESGRVAHTSHETQKNGTFMPAPYSADGSLSAVVHRVRTGEHPDRFRLVMELSSPVRYTVSPGTDLHDVIIDLPGVAWDAVTSWKEIHTSVAQSYDTAALTDDNGKIIGTRVYVRSDDPIVAGGQGMLPPEGKSGHRLFIDIVRNQGH